MSITTHHSSRVAGHVDPEMAGEECHCVQCQLQPTVRLALQITQTLKWLVRTVSDLETNVVSVERLHEYSQLKPEVRPMHTWSLLPRMPCSILRKDYGLDDSYCSGRFRPLL